ncbi:MAG: type III pantothenate kinase [Rhodanobacter sp.]
MRLLLDLGNSRLKWALQGPAPAWLAQGVLEWREDLATLAGAAWAGFPRSTRVVGASVVDDAREQRVAAVVRQAFGSAPEWLRTPASACGVRNAYAEPQRLGVDRFLAMVAAHASHRAPCVLASAGTALVVDALTADGRHLGGLIAPGVQLMQRSLLDATAQVRPQRPGDILQLADNTADAVTSGCWQAAAALIERFHAHMRPRLGGEPTLILDGGDAPRLAPLLSLPVQAGQDSVLRGLAVWADAHMATPASH